MYRSVLSALLLALLMTGTSQARDGIPSAPTNTIFSYAPLFGGPLTVRAAWSWPVKWNDDKATSGTRYYITECVARGTGEVVYLSTAPDGPILPAIQFDVPYPATHYTFRVYAVNKWGYVSKPGKYGLYVP